MLSLFDKGILVLGRYRILDHIRRGGMADVYKARDSVDGGYVALKVISRDMAQDPMIDRRFEREIRVLMAMDHPHIVKLIEVGKHHGLTVLVIPFLDVGSLSDQLVKGRVGLMEGARIIDQVAGALHYSHERGVIHRDVKSSNILLNQEGDAFLTDFGIARVHETMGSLTGSALLGTPAYMSPEQARGGEVTEKSDQYSLGVVLYQMATGQLPFAGETPMAVMYKHIYEPLPSPRSVRSSIPPVMERLILKATAKDPNNRFSSVAELQATFQKATRHILDPQGEPAPEIQPPQDLMKTRVLPAESGLSLHTIWRQQPTLVIGVIVFIVAVSVGLTLFALSRLDRTSTTEAVASLSAIAGADTPAYEGTINAMAKRLSQGETTIPAEGIQTLVAGTFQADLRQTGDARTGTTEGTPSVTQSSQLTGSASPGVILPLPTTVAPQTTSRPFLPTATRTRKPAPSATPTKTHTPTATLTATSTPTITPTPTPDVCLMASLNNLAVDGDVLRAVINNNGGTAVSITNLTVSWPRANEALIRVELDGDTIWQGSQTSPPLNLSVDGHSLPVGGSMELILTFSENAQSSDYSISVRLNNVCTISV